MARVPMRFRDGSLPLGARTAGPSIEVVRAHPEYVARAHAAGHQVHVWTVNDEADIALCSAKSRTVHVLTNTASANSGSSVKENPRSLKCRFISSESAALE